MEKNKCAALRGREDGQQLEGQKGDHTNSLTGVHEDNLIIRETKDGFHLRRDDKKQSSIQGTHITYPKGQSHCLNAHIPMVAKSMSIRRLTPIECERLQGFPEIKINIEFEFNCLQTDEFFIILPNKGNDLLCLDPQKNSVNVEILNHKSQSAVGTVEKTKLKENVKSAEGNSTVKNQKTNKHVQQHVLINCEELTVETRKVEKLLSDVNIAEKRNLCLRYIKPEDFAHLVADINLILEKIILIMEKHILKKH